MCAKNEESQHNQLTYRQIKQIGYPRQCKDTLSFEKVCFILKGRKA